MEREPSHDVTMVTTLMLSSARSPCQPVQWCGVGMPMTPIVLISVDAPCNTSSARVLRPPGGFVHLDN